MDNKCNLLPNLLSCEVFKVGNFKLKTGSYSPVYIDLRRIINFPSIIKEVAKAVRSEQIEKDLKFNVICGVPYTALPIASVFSVYFDVPMVMKRKEAKDYGTKKMVEGQIFPGDSCLIIEDIVSSGGSVIETAEALRKEGLKVEHCIVVVNRNQGGVENLKKAGINLHQLFDINEVFEAYCSINPVQAELREQVKSYFINNSYLPVIKASKRSFSYSEKATLNTNMLAKRLFAIMEEKKSNLCVAVDAKTSIEMLDLANRVGPFICLLKTHIDILSDFNEEIIAKLKELSKTHNFLIMEDRKFADIGNTVKEQFFGGIYKIQSWADLVTVHAIPGSGIIEALKNERCASVLIAQMSCKGALTNEDYKEDVLKIAESNNDSVVGYVAQSSFPKSSLIHMCPGISISKTSDSLGQQYRSPEQAIADGADIVIVGRGICNADNIEEIAELYKNRSFAAYMNLVSHT